MSDTGKFEFSKPPPRIYDDGSDGVTSHKHTALSLRSSTEIDANTRLTDGEQRKKT